MKVNGIETGKEQINELFKNFDCNEAEVNQKIEEHRTISEMETIKECNRIAEIPRRYGKARFGEFGENSSVEEAVKNFALNQSDKAFLLFGPTGLGKTTLMCSALHERAVMGLEGGLYFNCRFLMPILRTCRSFSAKENEESFVRRIAKVPFLCIDEIGASSNLKEEGEFLSLIICARYDNKLPTFLATNLDTLNFSLLIAGIDINDTPATGKKELCMRLKKSNATLDRFNSIATKWEMRGDSHRKQGE